MEFQAYYRFTEALPKVYERLVGSTQSCSTGTLFCAATPVLKLKDCYNHKLDDDSSSATSMLVYFKRCLAYDNE